MIRNFRDGFIRRSLVGLVALLGVWLSMSSGLVVAADRAPVKPREPVQKGTNAKPSDSLDRLFEADWKKSNLKPSKNTSDEEFVRRAYLDVVGRIPSVQEAIAFLQSKEPAKRSKLIDELLEHPDYDKNFATIWTVLLIGRKDQGRMVDRSALSSWLRKQFSSNRPWDEIVSELITAQGSNKANGAVNYALAHLDSDAVPLTSLTTRLFLGQQIQCTQCHDHPSNSWKQGDFWGINAFFKGLKIERIRGVDATGAEVDDHIELKDEPTEAYSTFDKRNGMVGVALPKFLDGRKIGTGGTALRRVELAKFIANRENPALSRAFVNRMWAHFLGRGFVNPVDDFGSHNPPLLPEALDRLADDFKSSGYDIKELIRRITASQPYQLSSLGSKAGEKDIDHFNRMLLKPMSPEQLFESLLTATGVNRSGQDEDRDRRRENWMRQFLFTFANDEGEEASSFQGTIPQALMMMNGDLINQALSTRGGSFLADVHAKSTQQGRSPEAWMVTQIYLASLSRQPTRTERAMVGELLAGADDPLTIMQDLFWALLNSNEFVLIH